MPELKAVKAALLARLSEFTGLEVDTRKAYRRRAEAIREAYADGEGLSVTEIAQALGVSRKVVYDALAGPGEGFSDA